MSLPERSNTTADARLASFVNDLRRALRLSQMLKQACKTLNDNIETPGYLAVESTMQIRAADKLIHSLKRINKESGGDIEDEMLSDDLLDRMELFDEISNIKNVSSITDVIRISKEEEKMKL